MASFRNNGLELNSISGNGSITNPTGGRVTVFAVSNASTGARYFAEPSQLQIWAVDSNGVQHEITNDWLSSQVANASAKLDFIYPAVSAFMSAGIVYNNYPTQDITGSLNILGNFSVRDNMLVKDMTSTDKFVVLGQFNVSEQGTNDTFEHITPFYIRSSANRIHPEGWVDPRVALVSNEVLYNDYKATDRGLRFTVLSRLNYNIVHDEVYDTAGSQTRAPRLAYDMFKFMNDRRYVGILNSRECWESLIGRKETAESIGLSATSINTNYNGIIIGSLIDQFSHFGLLKAVHASQIYFNAPVSGGSGSQYCSIFEGSDLISGNPHLPVNRCIESWVPKGHSVPITGDIQRACIAGWFIKPKNLTPDNNLEDTNATFVATPYSPGADVTLDHINFVHKDAPNGGANISVDARVANKLITTYYGVNNVSTIFSNNNNTETEYVSGNKTDAKYVTGMEYKILSVTGSYTNNIYCGSATIGTSMAGGVVSKSFTNVSLISHNFLSDSVISYSFPSTASYMTLNDNYLTGVRLARDSGSTDAVNKRLLDEVCPIGEIKNYGGTSLPAGDRFLWCDGGYYSTTDKPELFAAIGYSFGGGGGTFRVPASQGRLPMAAGGSYTVGLTGGETAHQLTIENMPAHAHQPLPGYTGYCMHVDSGFGEGYSLAQTTGPGAPTTGITGGDQPFNILPPYIVYNQIIRYR